jgi:hypothetical protein
MGTEMTTWIELCKLFLSKLICGQLCEYGALMCACVYVCVRARTTCLMLSVNKNYGGGGGRGGVVVKALRYKPAGRGFDPRWCH